METVTISPKFQVVIPKSVREQLSLTPGQKVHVLAYRDRIESPEELVVPALTLFEVFERISQIANETAALEAAAVMLSGRLVELTATLAMDAARLSIDASLAMADAIILTTARAEGATLWTQDAHFAGLSDVEYREKRAT